MLFYVGDLHQTHGFYELITPTLNEINLENFERKEFF